ncbi:Glycoside hydrolase family 5 protein [Mycena sanguinolenta]|uniref:glucan 1,3-beta-glucosidase n=1 Tax=Mycena sanguinolenta TaxID=230812 RepID=A0A8H6YVJ6_9AGAR|nr:Glycoside hydrolase family 5 protein [Mycena sanguinolenta]
MSAEGLTYSELIRPNPAFVHGLNSSTRSSQADSYRDDPDGYPASSPNNSTALLPSAPTQGVGSVSAAYGTEPKSGLTKRRRMLGFGALAALIVVILVVVLPVYFVVVKKHHGSAASSAIGGNSGSAGSSTSGDSGGTTIVGAVTGGDGSTVTMANGQSFIYNNSFGGYWVEDPQDPFNSGAKPNSWTPALNETWTWGVNRINGVNLGGWFVLEPFIVPALFQQYPAASDEWSLSQLMIADGTQVAKMTQHYDTFITEQDIAQIAGAGLNWVRLPIPFWAVSAWSNVGVDDQGNIESEPFLAGVCWPYIVRFFGWARKYGIRVHLDLHTAPGSQNGYNHSGKGGQINFLNGIMGIANAQRMLDYIRIITEFISQPEYVNLVPMFGIINEARIDDIGREQLSAFYLEAHNMIRGITGYGEGNGPFISIHDGFDPLTTWADFLPGSDRINLDTHPYFAFSPNPSHEPIATGEDPDSAGGQWPGLACNSWGSSLNTSREQFGVTVAGEFSNGLNDCGLYLNGVNGSYAYGDCTLWLDSSTWNASVIAGVNAFALASMDALGDWFFWTWKIGAAANGVVSSPLWSYQLGLEGGWIPTDPREAVGKCAAINAGGNAPFDGTFSAWQTGGAGAGTIAAAASSSFGMWPPATISNVDEDALTLMPTYTATGVVSTLTYTTPSVTATTTMPSLTVSVGNGWFDAKRYGAGRDHGCGLHLSCRMECLVSPSADGSVYRIVRWIWSVYRYGLWLTLGPFNYKSDRLTYTPLVYPYTTFARF